MRTLLTAAAAAAITLSFAGASQAADPAAGEKAFKGEFGCTNCHIPDEYDQAPPLAGVYGRKFAGAPDWPYCAGLKAKSGAWNDKTLDAFLSDTHAFVADCVMDYKITDPAKRADLIAYLKTLR